MKKSRILLVALLIVGFAVNMAGCYMVSGQKMDRVKGTYKLTNYTYTPSYERREGYTPKTRDYINDEKYLYEDYLVITGSGTGYYVHKEANAPAYVKEVRMSFEYNTDNSSLVDYVIYNDALTVSSSTNNGNRLGVSKNILNFSRPAFDYTQLFTNKPMRTEDVYVRWEKVDRATDLSYAQKQVGELKEYDYQSFAVRGIYELGTPTNIENGELAENPYQYYFYVIDTAKGVTTATVYYALKETPTMQVKETISLSCTAGDWSEITLDGEAWRVDPTWGNYYYKESDGLKYTINQVGRDITEDELEYWISCRMPVLEGES
ncbi:MAG: hypothetical protein E7461_05840 [Ruminococcaceae bacterium]|nr:hypothetical protein [Oscillospiraceae bacterium]